MESSLGMESSKITCLKNALKNNHAIQFKPIKIENTFKYFFSDFGWTPNAKMVCCT